MGVLVVKVVCVPPGPADVHFLWEKNGRELEVCVPAQTHALPDGRAHVLSWLRDALRESAEYRCSALATAGNKTSKVRVTVTRLGKCALLASTLHYLPLSLEQQTCMGTFQSGDYL